MMDNNWMVPFNTTQTQGNQLQLECIKTYCPREKASVYLISWILESDIQHKYINMYLDVWSILDEVQLGVTRGREAARSQYCPSILITNTGVASYLTWTDSCELHSGLR